MLRALHVTKCGQEMGFVLFDSGDHRCIAFNDLVRGDDGVQANQFLVSDGAHSALIDPGLDHGERGFFSRRDPDTGPMPAAEAETEKLPTQRPDLDPDQGSN